MLSLVGALEQFVGVHALEQIAERAALDRLEQILVLRRGGQHDDLASGISALISRVALRPSQRGMRIQRRRPRDLAIFLVLRYSGMRRESVADDAEPMRVARARQGDPAWSRRAENVRRRTDTCDGGRPWRARRDDDWTGKAERLSFDVPTLPLFIHERLSTKAIIETLTSQSLGTLRGGA
jgi:hypothetical protein